ncbi:hypothetical protein NE237_031711 [Protea cynaroides]|uniref:F-box domain-containing protein n=1 Tax=Protea cynaroides TaxID=273540 RepID=A0A9Q0L2T5_9MAGN|nr:hypothetical protein NE237_031711 [Protea cynaroides]
MVKEDEVNKKIRVEETVPTDYLPEDLIVDLLSRLPVKSLLRFRCVCKLWYALITDPAFVKMHLSRSLVSSSNLSIIFRSLGGPNLNFSEFRVSEFHSYSDDLDASLQQAVVELNHPFKPPRTCYVVGSCNGLLCVYLRNSEEEILMLWNPSTRRHQKLSLPSKEYPNLDYIVYGFGHDSTTDDYKIVRIVKCLGALDSVVNVFSHSTNTWRRIGHMPFCLNYPHFPMLLANSALHWFANREPKPNDISSFIVSFDLQDEEYRELPLPDFHFDFVKNYVGMKLGVLGGQLCVLCPYPGFLLDVWVMKDYGVRGSWEKQFSIQQPCGMRHNLYFLRPMCYSKNGEVIFQMDINTLVLYDPRTGRARNLRIHGVPDKFYTEFYVGSLVPLNGKDGTEQEKRKKIVPLIAEDGTEQAKRKKKNMKQRG